MTGDCKPYSITGSLPCIRDLQEAGFDVQTLGFGKLAAYHSNNGEHAVSRRRFFVWPGGLLSKLVQNCWQCGSSEVVLISAALFFFLFAAVTGYACGVAVFPFLPNMYASLFVCPAEFGYLSDFVKGFRVLRVLLDEYNK